MPVVTYMQPSAGNQPAMRIGQALNRALTDAMAADSTVVVFGEDVAAAGGAFGVTRGLYEKFGPRRVRDTPISEGVIAGAAVGAALSGLRPVVEIMFMDFITLAMDALVNQAAKAHFMFGGQCSVPLVIRTPHGGSLNAGPQHSQCLEAWFAHIPGLKVVVPSTASDAYGLLRASIEDPDPVVFVENKSMYALKMDVTDMPASIPIGHARIVRPGTDITIVTYGAQVRVAEAAAEILVESGVDPEIVDLRTIQPWDQATVMASVKKTRRAIVCHEAVTEFGVGAEIAATVAERLFNVLVAPVVRVGSHFMPVPFARSWSSSMCRIRRDSWMPSCRACTTRAES